MKLQIDIHLHFDAKAIATLLLTNQRAHLEEILQILTKNHKETKELIMKTQEQIDKLAADVKANRAEYLDALRSEAAEIKTAIDAKEIDTTELEAAIASNKSLPDEIKALFTPTTTEESPVKEEETSEKSVS